jgi:hypothetical protein
MLESVKESAQAICALALAITGKLPTCRALATELNFSVATAHALRAKFGKQQATCTKNS